MIRERALKIVMVLVGLLFLAGIYPVAIDLWQANGLDSGDDMMLSLYITLGIFLLIAVAGLKIDEKKMQELGHAAHG
ncbi:MAG: hypothetical protein WBC04_11715 [Candidatus Acidiferrales bacterium]